MSTGSDILKKKQMVAKLKVRFGDVFFSDLLIIYNGSPYHTLSGMGVKYGLSRERIRQIFKLLFGVGRNKIKKEREKLSCHNDPRSKAAEYKKGSTISTGAIEEKRFMMECINRGFDVKISNIRWIDLLVNNYKVDVKTGYFKGRTKKGSKIYYYHFNVSKKQKRDCDFIACYHATEKVFFIIPKNELPIGRCLFISENKTYHYASKNSFWKFRNAWHLLENAHTPKQGGPP